MNSWTAFIFATNSTLKQEDTSQERWSNWINLGRSRNCQSLSRILLTWTTQTTYTYFYPPRKHTNSVRVVTLSAGNAGEPGTTSKINLRGQRDYIWQPIWRTNSHPFLSLVTRQSKPTQRSLNPSSRQSMELEGPLWAIKCFEQQFSKDRSFSFFSLIAHSVYFTTNQILTWRQQIYVPFAL